MKKILFVLLGALALTSCSKEAPAKKTNYEFGRAEIRGLSEGYNASGEVLLEETSDGLKVDAYVRGLDPGKHGFHIHQFGDTGNNGENAGGHYNPLGVQHGYLPKDGFEKAHAGDFGNIEVDDEGNGEAHLLIRGLTLSDGPFSVAGRAFIIHLKPDDFGQPTGNAGGRAAGGPILIVDKKLQ